MGNYAAARDLDSDSGVETPVPALFIGRGCSSTPSLTPWTRRSHARPFGNPFWQPVSDFLISTLNCRGIDDYFRKMTWHI